MLRNHRRIELLANILIILVSILLIAIFIQRFFYSDSTDIKSPNLPAIGSIFAPEGLDFSKNKKNIILVLRKTCRFCEESVPFYDQLARETQFRDVRIVALMPSDLSEIRQYLDSAGLSKVEARQFSLESLGISATPTLIMVNESGIVLGAWVGKLSPEVEKEVIYKAVS